MNYFAYSIIFFLISSAACEKAREKFENVQQIKKSILSGDASAQKVAAAGENAANHLALSLKVRGYDAEAILSALKVSTELKQQTTESENENTFSVVPSARKLFLEMQHQKRSFKAENYLKIEDEFFNPEGTLQGPTLRLTGPTINWTAKTDDFLVANVGKIPVKDQGIRGTCATFSGIGQLEAMVLNTTSLTSIDLSEQRFYYMSKPENWQTGGDKNKGGSNTGTGYAKSAGFDYKGVTYPPSTPQDFNIPLEKNCPYNAEIGANDLQIPQASGCQTGVIKVTDFFAWLNHHEKELTSPQQILDFLVTNNLPVIVSSKLTENWENNSGMITLSDAKANGDSVHATGHAYLIVGAKKISEAAFPGEGGMCFIVKNSWTQGWGSSGFSCMTLAWFSTYMHTSGFPQAVSINVNTEALSTATTNDLKPPGELNHIEYDSDVIAKDPTGSKKKGKVTFDLGEDRVFGTWEYLGRFYKIFYRFTEDQHIEIFGLLNDERTVTKPIVLETQNNLIFLNLPDQPRTQVGILDGERNELTLCSGEFIDVCNFNYDDQQKGLTIGLSQSETAIPQEPFDWKEIKSGKTQYFFSHPAGINTFIDVKIKKDNIETNPLRFRINIENGEISHSGKAIGSINNGSLCSKDYSKNCFVIISGSQFDILQR